VTLSASTSLGWIILGAWTLLLLRTTSAHAAEPVRTRTPIKHVIVIIGENRSFDEIFGLYRPKRGQTIANLWSKGILNADGSPGSNFARAAQYQAAPQSSYYISPSAKTPYAKLPLPTLNQAPAAPSDRRPPFATVAKAQAVETDLQPADEVLLTTGASGLGSETAVDTRVANYSALPNGPFLLTGATLPYDAYTGDTIHRFYQMWQQSDCDASRATRANPNGCLNDLYPFVAVTFFSRDRGGSNSMGVFNVNHGDAPYLKKLADEFSSSDNFHQAFLGGTGGNHVMLGTGDAVFFSDANGDPASPPARVIDNPNPQSGTNNRYTTYGNWTQCADASQPGVAPVLSYLSRIGLQSKCVAGHFYMINNTLPGFLPNGSLRTAKAGEFVPPSNLRTIGDELMEKDVSFAYYGGEFNNAVKLANGDKSPATTFGWAYCQICNPFQYTPSVMANPARRAAHLKDVLDLYRDLANNTLPSVSFVKPDEMLDGHPASSKVGLFEAFLKDILDRLHANPAFARDTAVVITFDEDGGYWDSGYIQPLDFFGDGPRIPCIVVSNYSRGGRIVHTYYDHVSILKFIERNWMLKPLTARSRDGLPNPVAEAGNPYVPRNRPAIGDLFEMFDFRR
jgi:phospholipase C